MHRFILFSLIFLTCSSTPVQDNSESTSTDLAPVNGDFNSYWFSGKAEISSYKLSQARYGELHEGHSVLVYVTEPFNAQKMVKSDYGSSDDMQVLKLNNTKKFTTGIYPYSMMTSTFFPVKDGQHSLKVSSSSQEWCGHTYIELENREQFEITVNSYFEDESEEIELAKEVLEDDVWTQLRISPESLPTGELKVIPSFFYLRLKHKECKSYSAIAQLEKKEKNSTYSIEYPGLKRKVEINFETAFPHHILGWTETYPDGRETLTTSAELMESIQSDYWNKNGNKDAGLRKTLQID